MSARAEDYVSEVIYPDDLIPIEDLEGKFLVLISSSNFELRTKWRHALADSTSYYNNNYNNN